MRILCRDAEWLITRVRPVSSRNDRVLYCVGADDLTRGHEAAFIPRLEAIQPVDPRKTEPVRDVSGGYAQAKLFLEAQLRQMPLTDPSPHVNGIGAFEPMNYQIEVVRRAIGQLRPRLLLADAVGLGKTIEVGMILSELIRRGRAGRILVLAKKSMLTQFQAELWNRFAIPLVRMDSKGLARLQLKIPASKNPFEVYHRVIISIDTLKDIGRYAHFLENTRWDVVIIDEAHNVAGGANPEKHLSYRLARRLSRRTDSMILTTATPHNGRRETFGRLISLLDPSAVPDPKLREYKAEDIRPFFMMRFKEDVREEAGDNFASRRVIPLSKTSVDATEEEEKVYAALAEIRQRESDATEGSDAIVQWGMYKSFLSSPEACRSTAKKRLDRFKKQAAPSDAIDGLRNLIRALDPLSVEKSARFRLLLNELAEMDWDGSSSSPRILLFTESRVTQKHLCTALAKHFGLKFRDKQEDQPNQTLAAIHGGMPDTALAETVESFGTGSSPMRMLVATDVASEGVNLHHQCRYIIHYDLPWSIITLIQRNGRIDRFGQKKSPVIRYLMVNTRQGILNGDREIFQRLVDKVEEINRSTRTGESVLRLYDPKKEEEYIAGKGILTGNADIFDKTTPQTAESAELEDILHAAGCMDDDLLAHLTGQTDDLPDTTEKTDHDTDNSRVRLMSDAEFFEKGYRTLKDALKEGEKGSFRRDGFPDIRKTGHQFILDPPEELRRRLGAPSRGSDVIFGATAIPEEAWPDDGRLYLTTEPERVNNAISAALAQKGQWSQELLLTEIHPVMQWLAERLMMLMERGQAPLIASPWIEPGELLFCFIGQVVSRTGIPLIVDPHAVFFRKGARFGIQPLKNALNDIRFHELANTGKTGMLDEKLLSGFLESAVDQSIAHMKSLEEKRQQTIRPLLETEEKRLRKWLRSWSEKINGQLEKLPPQGRRAVKLRTQLDEMEKYVKDREENWRKTHLQAAEEPITRLILIAEGA